jgi:septal ring-binding cell division protein DamX
MAEAFPISGSIDPKTFPFLLVDLHRRSATGSFKVEGPSYQKALYFRLGRILFGSSNDPRDQLGSILIEDGKITPEQLEDVNAKVGPGKPLAKVLAETGVVSQRELSDAARAKVERILSDVIAYTTGGFEFEDGVLPKGAVDLKLSTERLVVGAVRRVSDRNFVLRHLETLDVVLAHVSGTDERWAELQSDASGLPEQLDGRTTLKEAISRTRLDEFEAAKVACALLFLGLVERAGAGAAAPAEVPTFTPADTGEELDLGGGPELSFAVLAPKTAPAVAVEPTVAAAPAAPAEPIVQPEPEPLFVAESAPTIAIEPEPATRASPPALAAEPPAPMPEPAPKTELPRPSSGRGLPIVPAPRREPPRPAPPPVTPRPASKEDLAALDVLLNPREPEGPLEPLDKGSGASFDAARGRVGTPPPRRALRIAVFLIAAAVLIALPVAIYYFTSPLKPVRPEPGTQVAAAGPAAPRRSPSPATMASPSPAASPTAAAPASVAPVASPSGSATAAAMPSPPARSPAAASPTPRPTASPPPKPPVPADPHALLAQGRYPDAARGFLSQVRAARPGSATVQLLVACSADTVQKAIENVKAPELLLLPVDLKGRECFRLCWGLFDSEARAAAALKNVPRYFREGGAAPRVVSTASISR